MHVLAAQDAPHHLVFTQKQPATLLRRRRSRVRHDLVAQLAREHHAVALAQPPPAMAGITMTSLPSGTCAALPPRVRASSSPMYTLT